MILKIRYINYALNKTNIHGILAICIIFFIILLGSLYYWFKTRKRRVDEAPTGFVLLIDLTLVSLERIVVDILGRRFRFLTLYAFFLMVYINLGNVLSLIGFETPITFLVVPLSLGLITFIGIFGFGVFFRRWRYFKKYLNPLEWISQFAPFISISFRIFGNLIAGFFVMSLLYYFLGTLIVELKYFNLLAVIATPFHIYFDLFSGFVQSFIFVILTFTYWSFERSSEDRKLEKTTFDNNPQLFITKK